MVSAFDNWEAELYHHGIKGQKWGIRRYQNEDGTLTDAGKRHYGLDSEYSKRSARKIQRHLNKLDYKYNVSLARQKEIDNAYDNLELKLMRKYGKQMKSDMYGNYDFNTLPDKARKRFYKADQTVDKAGEKTGRLWRLGYEIAKAAGEKGYSISSKEVTYRIQTGQDAARKYLFSTAMRTSYNSIPNYYFSTEVKGRRYKVKTK